jgi:hypothetical protein
MKKGFLHYATNDVYSVKSTVVEIPHFLPDFVSQAGVRKDKWSQEVGMWNKGGCAALVPHPSFLPMPVIPIGASRNEESLKLKTNTKK